MIPLSGLKCIFLDIDVSEQKIEETVVTDLPRKKKTIADLPRKKKTATDSSNKKPALIGDTQVSSRGFISSQKEKTTLIPHSKNPSAVQSLSTDNESDSETEEQRGVVGGGQIISESQAKKSTKKKRYLLFVGNVPKSASQEDVVSHFQKKGVPIVEFRLLTHKDSGNSKGCGFLELNSDKVMQNALKFHRSRLQGKHINVEVTCGGGGKSEGRRNKILEKNRKLRKKMAKPVKNKT